jgi:Glycosyl hydrolase family 26
VRQVVDIRSTVPDPDNGVAGELPTEAAVGPRRRTSIVVCLAVALGVVGVAMASGVGPSCPGRRCAMAAGAHTGSPLLVGSMSATLAGAITVHGAGTSFYFQYGSGAALTARTHVSYTPATRGRVLVRVRVTNLAKATRYRVRIVARNRYGVSYGATVVFSTSGALPAGQRRVLWGAEIGPQFTGTAAPWDMNAVKAFQHTVRKAPSILAFNIPFEGCSPSCSYYTFPAKQLGAIRGYGAIPMLNWASMSSPLGVDEPDFRLANVTSGAFDSYLRRFALAAKAWGHPFFLRFNWEMNGTSFPWAESANGNRPHDYVAAWRHVHDIFMSVDATNATWVWCPTVDPYHQFRSLAALYPGSAYVDWTCLDGYNYPAQTSPRGWSSFDQIYSATYNQIVQTIAPGKPFMIGEVASSEHGGLKAAWIGDMINKIANVYTALRAFVWFDWSVEGDDWPIETSSASVAAFAHGIVTPRFTTNTFRGLGPGTIRPPD